MLVEIVKSKKPNEKFDAVIDKTKTVSFGAKGYSDFTIHKDEDRKTNISKYIRQMKIGMTRQLPGFMLNMFYGTNLP